MLTNDGSSIKVDGMNVSTPLPEPSDPAHALPAVVALRKLADQLEQRAVIAALKQGWSWSQIAEGLGVTKQAAHRRLSYLQDN